MGDEADGRQHRPVVLGGDHGFGHLDLLYSVLPGYKIPVLLSVVLVKDTDCLIVFETTSQ